jgi:hypothetical protein
MHDDVNIGTRPEGGEPPVDTHGQRDACMQTWRGWAATAPTPSIRALTWAEWCARQQRALREEQCRKQGVSFFSEGEMAHLSFVKWLCQTGRLDP